MNPTQLSLFTADPNITLPYNTTRGFDMEERDIHELFRSPAQAAPAKDIHILVRVGMVRLEKEITVNIPHLPCDHLRPVHTTISGDHFMTAVGNHLTICRTSRGPYEMEDCVFIRRIHQVREDAEDTDKEL